MSVLDKVRHWIDGESAELVLEEAARDAQIKPRSRAEEFIVKIAKAVEEVMQNELVPAAAGNGYNSDRIRDFLSEADDKEWQGVKRRGLEQGLYHILAERAKEIAGKKKLETQSFSVELRVDGTLEKGNVRVQHSWEDAEGNKTSVLARPKPAPQPQAHTQALSNNSVLQSPNFVQNNAAHSHQISPAAPQMNAAQSVAPDLEEMTHVQKRQAPELFRLEIWRDGVRQSVMPIYQTEVSVGRGSKSQPVDVALTGDPEISRRHLSLICDVQGNFWAVNEGRNPALVNNYELPRGQKVSVAAGVPIAVCSYLLRIQPRNSN